MDIQKERAEFEKFASSHGLCVTEDGGLYRSHVLAWMWKAWKARAGLEERNMGLVLSDAYGVSEQIINGEIDE